MRDIARQYMAPSLTKRHKAEDIILLSHPRPCNTNQPYWKYVWSWLTFYLKKNFNSLIASLIHCYFFLKMENQFAHSILFIRIKGFFFFLSSICEKSAKRTISNFAFFFTFKTLYCTWIIEKKITQFYPLFKHSRHVLQQTIEQRFKHVCPSKYYLINSNWNINFRERSCH